MNKHYSQCADNKPQLLITRECIISRDYRVPICNEFADVLIQERTKRGLTQYALAKFAHETRPGHQIGRASHCRRAFFNWLGQFLNWKTQSSS